MMTAFDFWNKMYLIAWNNKDYALCKRILVILNRCV